MDQHQTIQLDSLGGAVVEMVLSNNRYAIGVVENFGSGTLAVTQKKNTASTFPVTFQLGQIQCLRILGPDERFNANQPNFHVRDRLLLDLADGLTAYGYLIREHENLLAVAGVVILPNKYHRTSMFQRSEIKRIARLIVVKEIPC